MIIPTVKYKPEIDTFCDEHRPDSQNVRMEIYQTYMRRLEEVK